jgi:DNA-binding MarR family transcriptional regulator
MPTSPRLSACNCFATRRAARYITRLYERHLSGAQLTSAQFSILALLDERGSETMNGLAKLLLMDRTTLLRALKPLQRGALLNARPSTDDARQLTLSLSPAGRRKLQHAVSLWQDAQREFEAQVGSARAARMRRDLLTLGNNG